MYNLHQHADRFYVYSMQSVVLRIDIIDNFRNTPYIKIIKIKENCYLNCNHFFIILCLLRHALIL